MNRKDNLPGTYSGETERLGIPPEQYHAKGGGVGGQGDDSVQDARVADR